MSTVIAPPEPKPDNRRRRIADLQEAVARAPAVRSGNCAARHQGSFVKLNPGDVAKNPVMFVVEVGAALTTVFVINDAVTGAGGICFRRSDRSVAVVHRAVRQLRRGDGGGARQGAGRHAAQDQDRHAGAKRLCRTARSRWCRPRSCAPATWCLRSGRPDPGDGEVIEGIASVDESVITGESAPVIRESGGDRSAVTGGTKVLSDQIKIRITSNPGETFSIA